MRHGWLLGLGVLLLVGCAKEKDSGSGWSSFPVAIYSDATISTDQNRADLYAAFSFWESKVGRQLFDYKGTWTGGAPYTGSAASPGSITANVIFFQNPWPFGATVAGQTTLIQRDGEFRGAIVMLNEGISRCNGNCQGETVRISQQKLMAHELGHFLGLGHSAAASDIMYPSISPGGSLAGEGRQSSA